MKVVLVEYALVVSVLLLLLLLKMLSLKGLLLSYGR